MSVTVLPTWMPSTSRSEKTPLLADMSLVSSTGTGPCIDVSHRSHKPNLIAELDEPSRSLGFVDGGDSCFYPVVLPLPWPPVIPQPYRADDRAASGSPTTDHTLGSTPELDNPLVAPTAHDVRERGKRLRNLANLASSWQTPHVAGSLCSSARNRLASGRWNTGPVREIPSLLVTEAGIWDGGGDLRAEPPREDI